MHFCRKILLLRFTHFFHKIFWTGEQTLQTFSLFGCMIFMYIFLKASNVEQHGLFLNTSADHLRLFELTKKSAKANQNSKGVLIAHNCVTKVCIVLFWMCRGTQKHIFPLLLWSSQSDEICKIIRTRVKPLFVNVLLEQWIWTFDDWRIICANGMIRLCWFLRFTLFGGPLQCDGWRWEWAGDESGLVRISKRDLWHAGCFIN